MTTLNLDDIKPYNTHRKCECGGDLWWMYYLSTNVNVKCDKCEKITCISPESKFEVRVSNDGSVGLGNVSFNNPVQE
jgi:hypothetical protein